MPDGAGFAALRTAGFALDSRRGAPFALYDDRLGNQPGDGARFKGRGFVQLTGRYNYAKYGPVVGVDLTAKR